MRRTSIGSLWLLASFLGTRCSSPADTPSEQDNAIVALVGGDPVRAAEVDRLLAKSAGFRPLNAEAQTILRAQALEELIDRRLVLAYARRTGLAPTAAEIDSQLAGLKAKLKQQNRSLEDFLKARSVSEADLRRQLAWNVDWEKCLTRYDTPARREAYFQAHCRELDGSRVSVSQILLRPSAGGGVQSSEALIEQAEGIRGRILSGEISFAEAAKKYSAAPSRKQGGRLGEIARHGAMSESFSRAAFALELGEVSRPVLSPFGVHLIRCDAVLSGGKRLSDVQEEVAEGLARELLEKLAGLERRDTQVEYRGPAPHFQPGTRKLIWPHSGE